MPKNDKLNKKDLYRLQCADAGPNRLAFYDRLIDEGNKPQFAAMLALQSPPGTKGTERSFNEGSHSWADKLFSKNRDYIFTTARKAGINPTGKVYKGGIGRPDDPMAWVSGPDDVLAACKSKGLSVKGAVNYDAPKQKFKKKRMGKDVMDRYVQMELMKDPGVVEKVRKRPKKMRDIQEKVIDKHSKKNLE